MNALSVGLAMALRDYPGYGLARRLRDGEGLEKILAGKLRAIAEWLSPSRDLDEIKNRLAIRPKESPKVSIKVSGIRYTPEPRPIVAPSAAEPAPVIEKLIGVRYTGEKKGEMQTFIRPTGRWVEYSALNPNLELSDEEAVWLLRRCKDFVRVI